VAGGKRKDFNYFETWPKLVGNIFFPAIGGDERRDFNYFETWPKLVGNIFSPAMGGGEEEISIILRHNQIFIMLALILRIILYLFYKMCKFQ
jgi:hypothetical protein